MASIPVLHTAKTAVTFADALNTTRCEHTFYFQDPTDNLFSDFAGFATQVWNAVLANLVPEACAQVVYDGVVVEDVRSVPYGGADFPKTPTPGTHAFSGAAMPTQNSLAIKRETGAVGRSYRGRVYWPIWNGAMLASQDAVSAAVATGAANALAAFQAAVEGGTYPCTMVLVSFQTAGAPNNPGIATPVTGWSYTDLNIDSQRRRLVGRGR